MACGRHACGRPAELRLRVGRWGSFSTMDSFRLPSAGTTTSASSPTGDVVLPGRTEEPPAAPSAMLREQFGGPSPPSLAKSLGALGSDVNAGERHQPPPAVR